MALWRVVCIPNRQQITTSITRRDFYQILLNNNDQQILIVECALGVNLLPTTALLWTALRDIMLALCMLLLCVRPSVRLLRRYYKLIETDELVLCKSYIVLEWKLFSYFWKIAYICTFNVTPCQGELKCQISESVFISLKKLLSWHTDTPHTPGWLPYPDH